MAALPASCVQPAACRLLASRQHAAMAVAQPATQCAPCSGGSGATAVPRLRRHAAVCLQRVSRLRPCQQRQRRLRALQVEAPSEGATLHARARRHSGAAPPRTGASSPPAPLPACRSHLAASPPSLPPSLPSSHGARTGLAAAPRFHGQGGAGAGSAAAGLVGEAAPPAGCAAGASPPRFTRLPAGMGCMGVAVWAPRWRGSCASALPCTLTQLRLAVAVVWCVWGVPHRTPAPPLPLACRWPPARRMRLQGGLPTAPAAACQKCCWV